MATVYTDDKNYKNIANTIRNGLNTDSSFYEKSIRPDEMPDAIISYGDSAYDAGIQSAYDAFWDEIQDNGNRVSYSYAFSSNSFTKNIFKPKYDMRPVNAHSMFSYMNSNDNSNERIDLVEHLESLGVVLDFSNTTSCNSLFNYNKMFTRLGIIDLSKMTTLNSLFAYATALKTIDKLILNPNGVTKFTNVFQNTSALENITIEGVISGNGLNLQWSTKLSKASITSVVNALSDTTSGLTVTLSRTAKEASFTDEEWEILIATKPNWTISLI